MILPRPPRPMSRAPLVENGLVSEGRDLPPNTESEAIALPNCRLFLR